MGTSAPGDLDRDQIIVLPPEAGYGKVCGGGVPDHRRLALISVRLPDREIGSTDFNDGLAMTNEGADGVLGADQLKAALAPICAKKFQGSHMAAVEKLASHQLVAQRYWPTPLFDRDAWKRKKIGH